MLPSGGAVGAERQSLSFRTSERGAWTRDKLDNGSKCPSHISVRFVVQDTDIVRWTDSHLWKVFHLCWWLARRRTRPINCAHCRGFWLETVSKDVQARRIKLSLRGKKSETDSCLANQWCECSKVNVRLSLVNTCIDCCGLGTSALRDFSGHRR